MALLTSASETSMWSPTYQLRGSPDLSIRMAPQASASQSVKMAPAHYSLRLFSWTPTDNLRSPQEVLRKVTCLGSCTNWARQKQSRGCWSSWTTPVSHLPLLRSPILAPDVRQTRCKLKRAGCVIFATEKCHRPTPYLGMLLYLYLLWCSLTPPGRSA